MKYRIADFNIEITSKIQTRYRKLDKYAADFENADIIIEYDETDLKQEMDLTNEGNPQLWAYKYSVIYRKLGEELPFFDAFILHSATFDIDGTGISFAARSGTGKSTHMLNWQKYMGDKMVVVNGDKPIIRFFDDEPETPYAYGTPWNGKESLGTNMRTQLKNICFIERSKTNYVEKVEKEDVIDRFLNQVYIPKNKDSLMNTMQLANRLLSCCDLWIIHCNMDIESAEVAYKAIFKK